jgi:integrase
MKTITKGFIAGLKPKAKRYDLYEDCLQTWVTPTGRVGFAFKTYRSGIQVRVPIGTFPSNKIDDYQRGEVQRRYADHYIEHTNSIPTAVIQQRQLSNRGKLVGNLFNAFIDEHLPTLRPETQSGNKRLLNNTLRPLHSIPLEDFGKHHILEVRRSLNARSGMQTTAMGVLRSCLNWGVQNEYLSESPFKNMPKAVTNKRTRVLKPQEIVALWKHLPPMLRFVLLTGQRVGEVVAMKWGDFEIGPTPEQSVHDYQLRYPTVRWTQPDNKTGAPHVLGLPQFAIAQLPHEVDKFGNPVLRSDHTLTSKPKDAVYVSQTTHKAFSDTRAVRYMFAKPLERSGIEHCTVHDFRRTALTNIARVMQSGEAAERVANHALGDVASRYNLYSFESLKADALMKWSAEVATWLRVKDFDSDRLPLVDKAPTAEEVRATIGPIIDKHMPE